MLMVTWIGRSASPKSWAATFLRIRSAKIRAPLGRGLGQQHHELLAAVAGHDVHRALLPPEDRAQLPQHPVARQVAVGVVDLLEVVDVHHQAGELGVVAVGPLHFLHQLFRQGPPVEGLGQRVGLGQRLHLLPAQHRALEVVRLLERLRRPP